MGWKRKNIIEHLQLSLTVNLNRRKHQHPRLLDHKKATVYPCECIKYHWQIKHWNCKGRQRNSTPEAPTQAEFATNASSYTRSHQAWFEGSCRLETVKFIVRKVAPVGKKGKKQIVWNFTLWVMNKFFWKVKWFASYQNCPCWTTSPRKKNWYFL